MDYLFVPGTGASEVFCRQVLSRRPNTVLISRPAAQNHFAGLLAHLTTLGPTSINPNPRPIGDILLVAHSRETGDYYVPLSHNLGSPADFEKADDANASDAVRLTAPLLTLSADGAMNTVTIRLKGCNIGKARPFVEKLREAMKPAGGTLNVTAPLHFDEFHDIMGGTLEYLAHKFTLKVAEPFLKPDKKTEDRDALLAAFDNAQSPDGKPAFTYLDGTAIPTAAWAGWIPNKIHPSRAKWRQRFDMQVDLNPAVASQTTVTIHREYRYEKIRLSWDWGAPNPGNRPDQLDILRNTLPQGTVPPSGRHIYDPAYPWPLYKRYGFTNIDDMVDHLDWVITYSKGTLHFRATRHEYTVMLPITDPPAPPANPVLRFYNFFPSNAAAGPAVHNLDETNGNLFLIL